MISRKRCSADSALKNPTNYQQMDFEILFHIIMSCKMRYYCVYIYPMNPLNEIRFAEFEAYTHTNIMYTIYVDGRFCSALVRLKTNKLLPLPVRAQHNLRFRIDFRKRVNLKPSGVTIIRLHNNNKDTVYFKYHVSILRIVMYGLLNIC